MEGLLDVLINKEVASLEYLKRVQGDSLSWMNVVNTSGASPLPSKDEHRHTLNAINYYNLGISVSLLGSCANIKSGNLTNLMVLLKDFLVLLKEYDTILPAVETNSTKSKLTGVTAASKRLFQRGKKSFSSSSSSSSSSSVSSPPSSSSTVSLPGTLQSFDNDTTHDEASIYSMDFSGGNSDHQTSNNNHTSSSHSYSTASLKRNLSNLRPTSSSSTQSSNSTTVNSPKMTANTTTTTATNTTNNTTITSKESGITVYDTSFTQLKLCQLPFTPDLHEAFISLCDILIDLFKQIQAALLDQIKTNMAGDNDLTSKITKKELSDILDVLNKIDERLKKSIIAATTRDIESVSKVVLGKEIARLDI